MQFLKEMNIFKIPRWSAYILPTNDVIDIYRYSDAMLKDMPKKDLKSFQNLLFYSQKAVMLKNNNDRRENNNNDLKRRGDNNIADRISKFAGEIKKKSLYNNTYLISCVFRPWNISWKLWHKIYLTPELDMNRLYESNAKTDNGSQPDTKIIIHQAPYISYSQIKLNKNSEVYFNSSLRAKNPWEPELG